MYCGNCGKEVNESDKYCRNCGKSIKEEQTKTGMKYFNFFSKYYMAFVIFLGIVSLITTANTFKSVENVDALSASLIIAEIILTVVLYIIVPIKLIQELPKKTKYSFYVLIGFLIINYIWRIISTTASIYFNFTTSNVIESALAAILFYAIWYIPNLIYFIKRKKLFVN